MDWWIVKQLRAMLLEDLRDFVPDGYFEGDVEQFKLNDGIENSKHFSSELTWGYLAGTLGQKLFFDTTAFMSARQVSACEVLMNLGMLAGVEATHGVTEQQSKKAKKLGISDGNAGNVAEQLQNDSIPTLSKNVVGSLEQYVKYLKPHEATPFLSLLSASPAIAITDNIADDEHQNIRILLDRMTRSLYACDYSAVLHASASVFETLAKDIIDLDSIKSKPLGNFFDRYRKDSSLPNEILNYISSIYNRRNTEPLAGHGSTNTPSITQSEAIVLAELTIALVKIERQLHTL
jgi:hypothetical protein